MLNKVPSSVTVKVGAMRLFTLTHVPFMDVGLQQSGIGTDIYQHMNTTQRKGISVFCVTVDIPENITSRDTWGVNMM